VLCAITSRFRVRRHRAALCAVPTATPRNDGHVGAFSRRECVRGLHVTLAKCARAVERREAPGVCATHPFEAGLTDPPRAAQVQSRARPSARRCASRRSTFSHQPVGRSGAPVQPAFALSAKGSPPESAPSPDRTAAIINPVQGCGIRNPKKIFRVQLQARALNARSSRPRGTTAEIRRSSGSQELHGWARREDRRTGCARVKAGPVSRTGCVANCHTLC
jgi:hypothetical protein